MLEAAGKTRAEIATAVGVSVSTIADWRKMDEYNHEVGWLKEQAAGVTGPIMQRIAVIAATAWEDSISNLRDIEANAVLKSGNPDWSTRMRASIAILESTYDLLKDTASHARGGSGGGGGGATAALVINLGEERKTVKVEGGTEVIDSTAERIDEPAAAAQGSAPS